jgi:hypothetical protein
MNPGGFKNGRGVPGRGFGPGGTSGLGLIMGGGTIPGVPGGDPSSFGTLTGGLYCIPPPVRGTTGIPGFPTGGCTGKRGFCVGGHEGGPVLGVPNPIWLSPSQHENQEKNRNADTDKDNYAFHYLRIIGRVFHVLCCLIDIRSYVFAFDSINRIFRSRGNRGQLFVILGNKVAHVFQGQRPNGQL